MSTPALSDCGGSSPAEHEVFAATNGYAPTVARTRTAQDEARWVDAWHMAYKWRADHWGQMPEAKYRRMIRARDRSDIAWKREREAVERTKAHTGPDKQVGLNPQ